MKGIASIAAGILVSAIATTGVSHSTTDRRPNGQTLQNLSIAMHGEAFAYVTYMAYAEHARNSNHNELAALLEKTAKTERYEHFVEEARLAGLFGSNTENLENAISGESYEIETMYRKFAQEAEQAGDHEVAQRFEEIRQDEAKHRDAFITALKTVKHKTASGLR